MIHNHPISSASRNQTADLAAADRIKNRDKQTGDR